MTKSGDAMKKIKAYVIKREDKKELPFLCLCLYICMCVPAGRFMNFWRTALRTSFIQRR